MRDDRTTLPYILPSTSSWFIVKYSESKSTKGNNAPPPLHPYRPNKQSQLNKQGQPNKLTTLSKAEDHYGDPVKPSSSRPRPRSREGCYTCRRRKKRCDEMKPMCSACVRLKLKCEYPLPGQERKNVRRKIKCKPGSTCKPSSDCDSSDGLVQEVKGEYINSRNGIQANGYRDSGFKSIMGQANIQLSDLGRFSAELSSSNNNNELMDFSSHDFSSNTDLSLQDDLMKLDSTSLNVQTDNADSANIFLPDCFSANNSFTDLLSITCPSTREFQNHLKSPFDPSASSIPLARPQNCNSDTITFSPSSSHRLLASSLNKFSSSALNNEFFIKQVAQRDKSNLGNLDYPGVEHQSHYPSMPQFDIFSSVFTPSLIDPLLTASQNSRVEETITQDDENQNKTEAHIQTPAQTPSRSPPSTQTQISNSLKRTNIQSIQNSQASFRPIIFSKPTPWYYQHLDSFGIEMFAYYHNHLANIICISSKMNSFLKVFVPMAEADQSVLYALVAYSSFHHTMGRHEDIGLKYLNNAIKLVRADLSEHKLTTLASMLIITTAEICKGDVVHWDKHLAAAADVIRMHGGMDSFTNDPTKLWLATNFAYHDLLAASRYEHRPLFEPSEYDNLLKMDKGVNTLIGCCKPIFSLLAEISELAVEAHNVYEQVEKSNENGESCSYTFDIFKDSTSNEICDILNISKKEYTEGPSDIYFDTPESSNESDKSSSPTATSKQVLSNQIRNLNHRVRLLEKKIDNCRPDPTDILSLSKSQGDLDEQLTLFETFQLTAKIHLLQSVGRRNAACLQLQVLATELVTCLDMLLNTKVEGSFVFPIFIASIMATTTRKRAEMVARIDMLFKRQLARNIMRALDLAEEVWRLDEYGTKYVNWYNVLKKNGWDLCFS